MQMEPEQIIELTIVDGQQERRITAATNQSLLDILKRHGIYINAPCDGRGTCGKCRIKLVDGKLLVATEGESEARLVEPGEMALACRATVLESCCIDIGALTEQGFAGNTEMNFRQSLPIDNGLEKVRFVAMPGTWDAVGSISESICQALELRLSFSAKALRQLSRWMAESLQQRFTAPDSAAPIWLTIRDNRVLHIRSAEKSPLFGIGVDIGTTTIALSLVDLETGAVVNSMTLINSQRQFGADVISRIQKVAEGFGDALQQRLRTDIADGVTALCRQETEAVVQLVIVGNPTVLHLLLGLRPDSLAVYPFTPVTRSQLSLSTAELFGAFPVECEAVLLPSLGAYVGADFVAGLMHCRMDKLDQVTVLIDLGTNGEMAIGNAGRVLCTSTAAGPAFEGANISCGTGSVPGAISRFDIEDGAIMIRTIGDAPPIGICGSGVVDIIAAGLREGMIDRTGRMQLASENPDCMLVGKTANGEAIVFTQKDVREFQLAKAAIRSGLEILLREFGCCWSDVAAVYIAGGFGARIDVDSAVAVGLLPVELRGKIQAVGNSALAGTVEYLVHRDRCEAVARLLDTASCIDLSRHPLFNDLFIKQLDFVLPE